LALLDPGFEFGHVGLVELEVARPKPRPESPAHRMREGTIEPGCKPKMSTTEGMSLAGRCWPHKRNSHRVDRSPSGLVVSNALKHLPADEEAFDH
jgi:hypothetical protein